LTGDKIDIMNASGIDIGDISTPTTPFGMQIAPNGDVWLVDQNSHLPEPNDGAWPARVLRIRRLTQIPETEKPATRLRFMHHRPGALLRTGNGCATGEITLKQVRVFADVEVSIRSSSGANPNRNPKATSGTSRNCRR
jgi:hypothetical protein